MIKLTKRTNKKNTILKEKHDLQKCTDFCINIKEALHSYISEMKSAKSDNEVFKKMLLSNFKNSIVQIDNNIQDLQNLNNILDILENQDTLSDTDIETYNNLYCILAKNIEIAQSLIQKNLERLDLVNIQFSENSMSILEYNKKIVSQPLPLKVPKEVSPSDVEESADDSKIPNTESQEQPADENQNDKPETKIKVKESIRKVFNSASDLQCFFPKNPSEALGILTIQENYKIYFSNDVATISVKDENFNISLHTSGVQLSNPNTSNVFFICHNDSAYTIITNIEMQIPPFIRVSKIAKNEEFLEVTIPSESLNLDIKNNIATFESESDAAINTYSDDSSNSSDIPTPKDVVSKSTESDKDLEKSMSIEIPTNDDEIIDNNTLIISDKDKKVLLPYKVKDLQAKLKKSKKYKTLKDIIDAEYIIPIDNFKNPIRSRFKEAFQLIKKKEHGSLKEAMGLGFELMFESELNPAIIAACKNLDELDVYLDCLDENELDKFSCFKILYNMPPSK